MICNTCNLTLNAQGLCLCNATPTRGEYHAPTSEESHGVTGRRRKVYTRGQICAARTMPTGDLRRMEVVAEASEVLADLATRNVKASTRAAGTVVRRTAGGGR